ncbi:MAG: ERCC4 domain-containing protein [Candidatus Bathyarchaeia archaeon]
MSPGEGSLLPYLTSNKDDAKRKPLIIVDSREANCASKIVNGLLERGAEVQVRALEKGDYILSDVCAVERKTIQDFVHTLTRRNLFDQIFQLKEAYPKALIVLEGYMHAVYRFSKIRPEAVWGALFTLAKNGISLINTYSYKETVDFLYIAARQEQLTEKRVPMVHHVKKHDTIRDAQIFLVASLPNIGREKAIALLKSYKTPINAFLNVDEWSKKVYGLGPKISSKAKEVLTTPFEE